MCGLVGIAGKLEFKDEHFMKHLLYLDMWRGKDSTGLAAVRGDGSVHLAKIASHPLDLFDTMRFKAALNGSQSRAFIGHNRAATKGAVNAVNAHPFIFDHIVGAHNGTLSQPSHKALEELAGEKFDVDSQAVFAAIAAVGIEETAKVLQGAWALSWVDTATNKLHFLRNKERELWYAYNEDRNHLIWASEYEFINYASKSGNTPTKIYADSDGYKFFPFQENRLYTFKLDALCAAKKEEPHKPFLKELKGKEVPAVTYNNNVHNPFGRTEKENSAPATHTSTTTSTMISRFKEQSKNAKADSRAVSMMGTKEDPFAGMITKERFTTISKDGCASCSATVEWGETGVTIIDRLDAVLCPNCTNHADSNRVIVPDIQLAIQ